MLVATTGLCHTFQKIKSYNYPIVLESMNYYYQLVTPVKYLCDP